MKLGDAPIPGLDATLNAQRIGIFGGTFDPVHNGHVALARAAASNLQLNQLRWVPAGQPWQKQRQLAPSAKRAAMVSLAIAGETSWQMDSRELQRQGPSYTLDTVRELQQAIPTAEWYLLIGQDQYAGITTWHGWQELLTRVTLAVAARDGHAPAPAAQLRGVPHKMVVVTMPRLDVSSSEIRERLSLGQSVNAMVPAAVARYIDQHRLYSETARS